MESGVGRALDVEPEDCRVEIFKASPQA
jgi:hypothetical protein